MLAFLQLVADILQRQKSTEHQLQTRVSNVFVELCLIFFGTGCLLDSGWPGCLDLLEKLSFGKKEQVKAAREGAYVLWRDESPGRIWFFIADIPAMAQ